MASIKQTFTYPWSRLKNGLVELQRWWPAHIKNDTTNGITVDPILYLTDFGPNTRSMEGSLEDEANTPGVRVECVDDDGSAPQQDATTTLGGSATSSSTSLVLTSRVGFSSDGGTGTIENNDSVVDTFTYTGFGVSSSLTGVVINSSGKAYSTGRPVTATGDAVCTVEISGSGTYSPKCKVTDTDGKTYEFYLIAPSGEGVGGDGDTIQSAYGITTTNSANYLAGAGSPMQAQTGMEGSLRTSGPYPVFMTIQEFAEMIDTYRHQAGADSTKPAWLPHGMIGRTFSASAALPSFQSDPRLSNAQDFPNDWRFRATVFMPMMLDNNQFDKRTTNASVSFAWPANGEDNEFTGFAESHSGDNHTGITRYPTDPDTSDDDRRWKELGYSGDHLHGAVGAWSVQRSKTITSGDGGSSVTVYSPSATGSSHLLDTIGFGNPDISLDTTAAIGPKYRMRMALACFLKDGIYTVTNGGSIIPYIYDSRRTIGGVNSETLYGRLTPAERSQYAVWDGKDGVGNSQPYQHDCSAQIYPLFDFVQGPIAPASQGNNFDSCVVELEGSDYPTIYDDQSSQSDGRTNPRQLMVRPNPKRIAIGAVAKGKDGDTSLNAYSKLVLYLDASETTFTGGFGMPVHIYGMTGDLGTDAVNLGHQRTVAGKPVWSSNDTEGGWDASGDVDHNGWWIIHSVGAVTTGGTGPIPSTYQKVVISINYRIRDGNNVAAYALTDAYLTQGRLGGAENKADALDAFTMEAQNLYQIGIQRENKLGPSDQSIPGTGTGFFAGPGQPDCNTPVGGSSDSTYPGRPTIFKPGIKNTATNGYEEGQYPVMRSISIHNDGGSNFTLAPTVANIGGGSLRIPPPIGWDLAFQYYSGSQNLDDPYVIYGTAEYGKPDYINNITANSNYGQAGNDRWGFRGIHIPFWSAMDPVLGRHAWDYIKPDGWLFGRNRPWPGTERVGTKTGYMPTPSGTNKVGLTEWGCSPVWLDLSMTAFIPIQDSRLVLIEFDNNLSIDGTGRHSLVTHGGTDNYQRGHGFYPLYEGTGDQRKASASGCWLYGGKHIATQPGNAFPGSAYKSNEPPVATANRPAIYAWGRGDGWFNTDWEASEDTFPVGTITTNNGWGTLGGGSGYGTAMSLVEGSHTIRAVFTDAGMTYILDGSTVGTDPNGATSMWGMVIKVCDAISLGGAEPGNTGTTSVNNLNGEQMFAQNPNYNTSQKDLQIDSMTLRQIPTNAMLPFNVDTVNQKVDTAAKYRSLTIEADNISSSKGMLVRVSIMQPPSLVGGTIEQEATTAYAGFDSLDPNIIGGFGNIDLSGLPTAAITNGFMVRFHFYIPDKSQTDMHPINWSALPIIRAFTVTYDVVPTAAITCIGNTLNNDITSPVVTKVGHLVSFRITGTTTDADRTLASTKIVFGDDEATGYMTFADTTTTSTTMDVSHVYTKAGTFNVTAYVKDDADNISAAAGDMQIVVAETLPVAVLRATPAQVQAGSDVTFDGSSSYIVSSDPARTIAAYNFDPGDGSGTTSQAGATFTNTYATAGEYLATLTVDDNASSVNVSIASKAVIRVLATDSTTDLLANLNTQPHSFSRTRRASLSATPTLDGTYPEVRDLGQRIDDFSMEGSFLKGTATADIEQMETYLNAGTLLTIKWQQTAYGGGADVKTFVGRMTSFDYDREGGKHGETPWMASFRREE